MAKNLVTNGDFENANSSVWYMTETTEGGVQKETEELTNNYCKIYQTEATYQDIPLSVGKSYMLNFKYRGTIDGKVEIFNYNSNISTVIVDYLDQATEWTPLSVQFTVDYTYDSYRLHFRAGSSSDKDATLDIDDVVVTEVSAA